MQARKLVHERRAMLAGMKPVLQEGTFFFCTVPNTAKVDEVTPHALALFREDEGTALVLREADAREFGFDMSLPMARIILEVFSALDGVGLTAGVATALADQGIPCNMIAAYHHDNVFVPKDRQHDALRILEAVQRAAAASD